MGDICNIKVNLNQNKIKKILNNGQKGLKEIAEEIKQNPYVPIDTGAMANSAYVEQKGNKVVIGYNSPYAARQYFHPEYNHPHGGKAYWLEDYISGAKEQFFVDTFKKYF